MVSTHTGGCATQPQISLALGWPLFDLGRLAEGAAVLDDAVRVDSATVRTDLRQLARIFSRYRAACCSGEIYSDLVSAIGV